MFTYYIYTDNITKREFIMWTTEAKRVTSASKEQIWKLWADVSNWNVWDKDVESSQLFGEFKTGIKGVLKPAGGPKTKFEMTECTYLESFTDRSFLPFCKMDFIHSMIETGNGIEITHRVVMTGFLTFLFSKVIGSKIKFGLPAAIERLIKIAEKRQVTYGKD